MKLKKSFGTLMLGGALAVSSQLLAIQPANAALLAQYNFNGSTLANSAPTSANYSASPFGVGAGLAGNSPGTNVAKTRFSNQTKTATGNSLAVTFRDITATTKTGTPATPTTPANPATGATTQNSYFKFTLTPIGTPEVPMGAKFTSLSFTTDVGQGAASAVGNFFVQANLGAGGAFIDLVSNGNAVGNTVYSQAQTNRNGALPVTSFTQRTIDLTGLSSGGYFTNPVEFRIYMYDNGATGTSGGLRVDDVQLQGVVAPVPELSTGLLVALAMGALCIAGTRRKKGSSPAMNMAF